MRLVQYLDDHGRRAVAVSGNGRPLRIADAASTYGLAQEVLGIGGSLAGLVARRTTTESVDLDAAEREGRLLPPLDHPSDHAHMLVTGTGLSHLGSAEGRDQMHRDLADAATLTDSMRMFKLGLEGGKPAAGQDGAQPEWFYKGDGGIVAASGQPLVSPSFALDGGEEPEVVGLYLIGADGTPWRVGWALGNEFSDHVTEKQNYLYLAHSKLRACAIGPELLVGELPRDIRGTSRIRRDGGGGLGEAVPLGRGQYVPLDREPRATPLQVPVVPPPRRRPCALFRHLDAELLRRVPNRAGRHVRDPGARVRPAVAQCVGGGGDSAGFAAGAGLSRLSWPRACP